MGDFYQLGGGVTSHNRPCSYHAIQPDLQVNFLDDTATNGITAPTSGSGGARAFTVTGKRATTRRWRRVGATEQFRLESGASTNGWTNWTTVRVLCGTNVVRRMRRIPAQCLADNSVSFVYVASDRLLIANGRGTIRPTTATRCCRLEHVHQHGRRVGGLRSRTG